MTIERSPASINGNATMTAKELREKRAPLAVKIRKMADEANADGFTADAAWNENWTKLNDDYNALTRQIEIAERAETIDAEQRSSTGGAGQGSGGQAGGQGQGNQPGREDVNHREADGPGETRMQAAAATEEQRALAMQAWFANQAGFDLRQDQIAACRAVGLNPNRRELVLQPADTLHARRIQRAFRDGRRETAEQRALSAISGSAGAYTIPEGFVNQFELSLLAFGGMREVAEIIRTDSGNDLPWPTADDTSNTGELLAENTEVAEQDVTVGQITWKAYKYSSKMIKVPVELLQDSAFNLPSVLAGMLATRLARITNTHYTTGNAASKPNGVVTASGLGVTTASATAITGDEIIDLIHSLNPAYRVGARFMFHDNILLYVRKLKDGMGQYLWGSGLNGGSADTLAGYPFTINQDMQSSVATATKTMLFGQFSKYKIRDVREIRVRRLPERYAELDQEAFVAFLRTDGNLLDAGTDPIKHMLQA